MANTVGQGSAAQDRFHHLGIAAGLQAWKDSANAVTPESAERFGINFGSGIGGLPLIEDMHNELLKSGPRRISPFFIPGTIINMIAGNLSIMLGTKGPNLAIVTACTTSTHCIGEAAKSIRHGEADVMIAGGAEATVTELAWRFASARALSTRKTIRPARAGPGTGSATDSCWARGPAPWCWKEYEHAKQRGARILLRAGRLRGIVRRLPHDRARGGRRGRVPLHAQRDARRGARIESIDYINAHGTSTELGDIAETVAVKRLLGERAMQVAVNSTKSMTGHLLGAAGGVEAIFSILALVNQVSPPTINLHNPDPKCDLDYVPNKARKMAIRTALSNSFGFGGTNGTLVFKQA